MTEYSSGYGNEPIESIYENGRVIDDEQSISEESKDALFESIDKLVDQGVANYADAFKRLGYNPDEYSTPETSIPITASSKEAIVTPGASVSLRERTIAVTQLMDGISAQNRLSGAVRSDAIQHRYSNSREVLNGMQRKAEGFRQSESRAVEMLAKTAALRAAGFNESEIAASEASIRRTVASLRKTGKQAIALRNKQKNVVARTEKKVTGRR